MFKTIGDQILSSGICRDFREWSARRPLLSKVLVLGAAAFAFFMAGRDFAAMQHRSISAVHLETIRDLNQAIERRSQANSDLYSTIADLNTQLRWREETIDRMNKAIERRMDGNLQSLLNAIENDGSIDKATAKVYAILKDATKDSADPKAHMKSILGQ